MLGTLKQLLAVPDYDDEVTNGRAQLLNFILLSLIALVTFLYFVRFSMGTYGPDNGNAPILAAAIGILLVLYILTKFRQLELAAPLLVILGWLVISQVRHSGSLGDLPLVVISATRPVWWPDMPGQVNPAKFRKMWLYLQQNLTTLSANSRQVFADQSSHFVQFDQPTLVSETIRQMVANTRQPSRSR